MKKLMIAFALVAMATCAQAVQYSWRIGTSMLMSDGKGTTTTTQLTGVDVYVFCSKNYSQDALIAAFAQNGTFDTSRAVGF